jgi:hypothetical protein
LVPEYKQCYHRAHAGRPRAVENRLATIAARALIGEIKPGEAVKQLQALPSPPESFKVFRAVGSASTMTQQRAACAGCLATTLLAEARKAIATKGRDESFSNCVNGASIRAGCVSEE